MTYLVAIAFLAILGALAAALLFMIKGGQQNTEARSKRMARALALRVGVSILLFVCILVSWYLGWIQPTGIPPGK